VNRELLEALVRLSAELQKATSVAKQAGRADVFRQLRDLGWVPADCLTEVGLEQAPRADGGAP